MEIIMKKKTIYYIRFNNFYYLKYYQEIFCPILKLVTKSGNI